MAGGGALKAPGTMLGIPENGIEHSATSFHDTPVIHRKNDNLMITTSGAGNLKKVAKKGAVFTAPSHFLRQKGIVSPFPKSTHLWDGAKLTSQVTAAPLGGVLVCPVGGDSKMFCCLFRRLSWDNIIPTRFNCQGATFAACK